MPITRRDFVAMAAGAAAFVSGRAAADADNGLFWRVEMPDGGSAVVFGYGRIAAALTPDIVEDGARFAEIATRVVLDMQDVQFPPLAVDPALPPLLPKLDAGLADEVSKILSALQMPQAEIEKSPGFVVASLLYGEGQTKPDPSVGGVIAARAQALALPIATVLSAADVERLRKPIDLAELDKIIDGTTITFLLDTRRRVGPIGAYGDALYQQRKGEELARFTALLREHHVPQSAAYLGEEASREMLLANLPAALKPQEADDIAFCLLPIGVVTGPNSILASLRQRGAHVTNIA